jgi:hypothetical protein
VCYLENLKNEEVMTRVGLQRHKNILIMSYYGEVYYGEIYYGEIYFGEIYYGAIIYGEI